MYSTRSDIDKWAENHGTRSKEHGSDYEDMGMWGEKNKTCVPKGNKYFNILLTFCAGLLNSNWLELFKHVTLRYFRPQNYKQSGKNDKEKIWNKGRNIVCNVNEVYPY